MKTQNPVFMVQTINHFMCFIYNQNEEREKTFQREKTTFTVFETIFFALRKITFSHPTDVFGLI